MDPIDGTTWADRTRRANLAYRATLEPTPVPGPVQMGEIAAWLNARLPENALICNGAGNYATWMPPLLPVPRVPDPAGSDQRFHGLRHAGGGRGQAGPPGPGWCSA